MKNKAPANTDGYEKQSLRLVKVKTIKSNQNFNYKSCKIRLRTLSRNSAMRSTQPGCRNHLSFFKGRGAKAIMCNHIVTIRVLRYPLLYQIL